MMWHKRQFMVYSTLETESSMALPTDSGRESRPEEFHPEALAEPDRTLSRHPAPIMEPCYVPTPSGRTTLDNDARCSRSSA